MFGKLFTSENTRRQEETYKIGVPAILETLILESYSVMVCTTSRNIELLECILEAI